MRWNPRLAMCELGKADEGVVHGWIDIYLDIPVHNWKAVYQNGICVYL